MTELAKQFQSNLNKIFGDKHVKVRIIHDDRDICINSSEREILYAIQEQQQSIHNLHWSFSERFLTKALTISFKKNPIPHFQGIAEIYKKYFDERIQLIINKCDKMVIEHNKQNSEYETVKRLYQSILSEESVDYEQYRKIRGMFENIRYLQQC
jgi:hypothetical protein